MNIENLNKVIDVLEHVQERIDKGELRDTQFNLNVWGDNECGTVACAMGWVVYHQALPELMPPYLIHEGYQHFTPLRHNLDDPWEAVRDTLGLTRDQATFLFDESSYDYAVGPQVVADRIRSVIDAKAVQN